MSKILKNSILNKLKRTNASLISINTFTKKIDDIITSRYKMKDQLNIIKNYIDESHNTWNQVYKLISGKKREEKIVIKNNRIEHVEKINEYISNVKTSFQGSSKNAFTKVVELLKKNKLNININQLKVNYKRKGIVSISIDNRMTRDQIKNLGYTISKIMKNHIIQGDMGIAMKYSLAWAPALISDYGREVRLWSSTDSDSYEEETYYERICIYMTDRGNRKKLPIVGTSEKNSCLYDCLWYYLHDNLPWQCDYQMKKALKLPPNDKIDLKYIPVLEKLLKTVSINVTGDFTYTSSLNKNLIIDLIVYDEHCTVNYEKIESKVKNISSKELKILMYNKIDYTGYDGVKIRKISMIEKKNILTFNSNYILIIADPNKCLIEQYNEYIENANLLKENSKLINIYKSGSISQTSLNLFERFTHHIRNPPKIEEKEAEFISNSKQGALIFGEEYNGVGHKFDIVSSYPSIMNSKQLFPINKGEFKKSTKEEFINLEFYQYGIYRCNISGNNKQFRKNKLNYYTHIDLNEAKRLNLKVKLIIDSEPNFLYYSRNKLLTGTELFGQYVDHLYQLKKKNIKISKLILNILWGKLCQTKIKKNIVNNEKMIIIDDEIKSIMPYNNSDNIRIDTYKKSDQFTSGWARISSFIMSKGREKVAKIIDIFGNDNIVRCHTDGIISKIYPNNIELGENLGLLKFEESSNNITIKNCNSVLGFIKKIGK